jgi:hypothetical protein
MEGTFDRLGYVADVRLRQSWDVRLRHGARVDEAVREIPEILVLLEETGWDEMERGGFGCSSRGWPTGSIGWACGSCGGLPPPRCIRRASA